MNKNMGIIGVQMDFGASKTGVNMGPLAIRHAGLCEGMKALGYTIFDKGDIIPPQDREVGNPKLRFLPQINNANHALFNTVKEMLEQDLTPVVLGGDHSIAVGSIGAAAKHFGEIGVLWVDAHGDFNDEESSPSGNIHGMPLSAVAGMGPDCLLSFVENPNYVSPKNICYIGIRDLDPKESLRMKEAGVTVFTCSHIEEKGIVAVVEEAIAITTRDTKGVYVSFDMDSISPEQAPGVGTPVPYGLTVREAYYIAEHLYKSGKILGIDMVEVNPMLDHCNQTGELACGLTLALLGQTKY